MKKLFILVAALVFTVAVMADTIDVKGYRCKISNEQSITGNTIDYCLVTTVCNFHFAFDNTDEVEIGTTYNLNEMNALLSVAETTFYALSNKVSYQEANFTRTSDTTYTAFVKTTNGDAYNISISSDFHITHPKDTVSVTANNKLANRLTDNTATNSMFSIIGQDEDNSYRIVMAFQSDQLAGTYTSDDVIDEYTTIVSYSNRDTSFIRFYELLPDALVSGNASNLTAAINVVGGDSVLYVFFVDYVTPVASEEKDFVASNLEITMDNWELYWGTEGYGVFAAYASNNDYILAVNVATTNESYNGTYTEQEATVQFYNKSDGLPAYESYTTNFTLAENGTALSLTGTALCYGDVKFNINVTGVASAVEEVEASDYVAYTEGRTIILNGAEGQNIAIYDIAGRMISSTMVNSDNARFDVVAGVYLVRVNGQSLRVVVK